jgi:phenylalanyl-tRNA synthetase beta chain
MRILQSWLHDYITFSHSADVLAEKLTMLGLEFESVERLGEKYRGFVVGRVLSVAPHPHADRLTVCSVDVGKETLQIVCGARNVAAGQTVAVGLPGATVPKNQHDPSGPPFVLSRTPIRGVESAGMICSEFELDLGKDADGILVLEATAKAGQSLSTHLGLDDVAYDVEITPNRPDWLSHIGIAREIGILLKKKPRVPRVHLKESRVPISRFLSVRVEDKIKCPRFAARMIRGVRIGPSPGWMQERLRNAGLRPRNNVVDITNYVMLECGHPLHAFDYALLRGRAIVVRQAAPGTRFTTLDGKEHELPDGAIMVCDADREVSIAGVMGGANSEINDATVDVVLEAAYWNPSSIRRTAKTLGISTDASQRFERGADPNGVTYALDRSASLVAELAGGTLLKGTIDVYPKKISERVVPLRPARVNAVLGTTLTPDRVAALLKLLDIRPARARSGGFRCTVPTYRVDVNREIDLIEEVARVYGYDRIEPKTSAFVEFDQPFPRGGPADAVRNLLVGAGFMEAITISMQDEGRARADGKQPVRIVNPLGQEMAFLRTSLVPGLLDVIQRNQSFGNFDLRFFEIGHVFREDPDAPGRLVGDYAEEERVVLILAGNAAPRHWSYPPRKADILDLKGEVAGLVEKIALDKCCFISYSTSDGLTDNSLAIEIHGSYAGYLGRVKESFVTRAGVEGEVFAAEISLASLRSTGKRTYEQLPRFPKVRRDISLFVDLSVSVGSLETVIRKSAGELLVGVELFDVYQGEKAPSGKKSLAFTLELMSRQKTLTDAEIEATISEAVSALERESGAVLRSVQ